MTGPATIIGYALVTIGVFCLVLLVKVTIHHRQRLRVIDMVYDVSKSNPHGHFDINVYDRVLGDYETQLFTLNKWTFKQCYPNLEAVIYREVLSKTMES